MLKAPSSIYNDDASLGHTYAGYNQWRIQDPTHTLIMMSIYDETLLKSANMYSLKNTFQYLKRV